MKSALVLGVIVAGVSIASFAVAGGAAAGGKKSSDAQTQFVGQRRFQRSFDVALGNGCSYRATVSGTIDGVREHGSKAVQLRPDLFVDVAFECPREKPMKLSRHLVDGRYSAEDLDEALRGAMSVPTGGCFYVPDLQRKGPDFEAKTISWMCPSETSQAIGGGPKSIK